MMNAADFQKAWSEICDERRNLVNRRTDLETELVEVRNKIAHLDQVLTHLAPLADLPYYDEGDLSGLGITDAVRFIVKHSDIRLSPQDVRGQLAEKGYDLSALTVPMASIYKILSRLVDDSGEVEREKEGGRVYYKWKPTPISDEDIPF
jgi:hypothetical protein